jgi:hypothetical protein
MSNNSISGIVITPISLVMDQNGETGEIRCDDIRNTSYSFCYSDLKQAAGNRNDLGLDQFANDVQFCQHDVSENSFMCPLCKYVYVVVKLMHNNIVRSRPI